MDAFPISALLFLLLAVSFPSARSEYSDDVDKETAFVEGQELTSSGFPKSNHDVLRIHPKQYDTASVRFIRDDVTNKEPIKVWLQTHICLGCKLLPITVLKNTTPEKHCIALIDTQWGTRIRVTSNQDTYPTDTDTFCQLDYNFGAEGAYNLTIPMSFAPNGSEAKQCGLVLTKAPVNPNLAISLALASLLLFMICAAIYVHCLRDKCCPKLCRRKSINSDDQNGSLLPVHNGDGPLSVDYDNTTTPEGNANKRAAKPTRMKSVDTFRGLTIWLLILATTGSGFYFYALHAKWYGITLGDCMFPWFIFIMGTSIHLAFNVLLAKGKPFGSIYKKLVIRSIMLFVIGICIDHNNDFLTLRIPGVLQRFGITYFITASSYLFSRWLLGRRKTEKTGKCYMMFRDIIDYIDLPVAACCITAYLCLTFLLPVPGCPKGYMGPGGPLVGKNGELTNCTGGAAGYVDRMFFTEAHILGVHTAGKIYKSTVPSDPEGIVGTFNSIALCILGLQAGKILTLFSTTKGRVIRLVTWGLVLLAISVVLSKGHMADGWIPLVKNLWSLSYILLTGGLGFIAQAICHVLIDVTGFWNGAPLIYAGMNSLVLYLAAGIFSSYLPFSWAPFVGNHTEYIIMTYWSMTLWLIISYYLFKKKIFIKL